MALIFGPAQFSVNFLNGFQFLLDLAIKSVIVMLAAWALTSVLRRASAASRHWVWSVAVVSLLALPVLSLMLPSWQLELLPSLAPAAMMEKPGDAGASANVPKTAAEFKIAETAVESVSQDITALPAPVPRPLRFEIDSSDSFPIRSSNSGWLPTMPSFVKTINWGMAALMFWLAGAALVLARLLAGTLKVWRLANLASQVTEGGWLALARNMATRLRLQGTVELRKSNQVRLPMTWGAWRSVVMLPADADEWPQECRRIVLLHELAHVKRRDCLTQNLAQLACALYWFNPLVWLAAKQLHVERELACDDQVLEVGTKASEYASHLVEIARSFSASPELSPVTVGMACSQLESRVRSILDPGVRRRGLNRLSAGLIGLGAIGLVLSLAIAQPWSRTAATARAEAVAGQQLPGSGGELSLLSETPGMEVQATSLLSAQKNEEVATADSESEADESREQEGADASSDDAEQDGSQAKAQSSELTADQLIQMKAAGVTPEFIEAMRKQGFDGLSIRDLTQLSIHGINADFIKQARSWGGERVTVRDIVQLKISGVTAEYLTAMKRAGYDNLSLRQAAQMGMHGVTPEFIEAMRRLGYDNLTANQISSLKLHGIDEAFIAQMQSRAGNKLSVNDLLQMKIHGVTPEFANRIKAAGYDNLSINKLTEMKIHGVDEDFIQEMQNWTGGKPTINELMQLKIHGVTPEFANRMKALGFGDLPIKKLTELKIHGVDEQYVKEMRDLGFDKLTMEQLLKMRIHGVNADYIRKMRAAGLKNVSANEMIEMKIHGIDAILLKEKR